MVDDQQESEQVQEFTDDRDAPVELGDDASVGVPGAGDIRAESVTLTQGGASSIEATTVSISQGGAGRVRAGELTVSQGGVGLARTDNLTVEEGGSAFAVLADTARVEEGASVVLLVARNASGGTIVDWRAALAFGAGLGLALFVVRRLLRFA